MFMLLKMYSIGYSKLTYIYILYLHFTVFGLQTLIKKPYMCEINFVH